MLSAAAAVVRPGEDSGVVNLGLKPVNPELTLEAGDIAAAGGVASWPAAGGWVAARGVAGGAAAVASAASASAKNT